MFWGLCLSAECELCFSCKMVWPFLSGLMCGAVKPIDLTWTVCGLLSACHHLQMTSDASETTSLPKGVSFFFFLKEYNVKVIGSNSVAFFFVIHVKMKNEMDKSVYIVTNDWPWASELQCFIINCSTIGDITEWTLSQSSMLWWYKSTINTSWLYERGGFFFLSCKKGQKMDLFYNPVSHGFFFFFFCQTQCD